jgi:hypothetical protein
MLKRPTGRHGDPTGLVEHYQYSNYSSNHVSMSILLQDRIISTDDYLLCKHPIRTGSTITVTDQA